jgi:hypothetical protein
VQSIGASANPLSSELSQVSIPCRVKRATQRSSSARHMLWPQDQDHGQEIGIRRLPSSPDQQSNQTRRGENTSRPLDTLFARETDHLSIVEWTRSRGHHLPVLFSVFTCEHAQHEPRMSQLTHPSKSGCAQPSLTHQQFIAIVQCEASLTTISIDTAHSENTSPSITNSHLIN